MVSRGCGAKIRHITNAICVRPDLCILCILKKLKMWITEWELGAADRLHTQKCSGTSRGFFCLQSPATFFVFTSRREKKKPETAGQTRGAEEVAEEIDGV
jgi:hypothetical protein